MVKKTISLYIVTVVILLAFSSFVPMISVKKLDNIQIQAPWSDDVDQLITQYENRIIEEQRLFIIYFDNNLDYLTFVNEHDTELRFDGLLGAVIQCLPSNIKNIAGEYDFLSTENFHRIVENSPLKVTSSIPYDGATHAVNNLRTAETLGIKQMWDWGYYGNDSRVAVMDNGILENHPDFEDRIIDKKAIVNTIYGNSANRTGEPGSHGTPVAGVIAGAGISNADNIGMAPEALLYDIDGGDTAGSSYEMTDLGQIAGVNWAIENDVDIINMSFGIVDGDLVNAAIKFDTSYVLWQTTLAQATKQGILFVKSAGNEFGLYTISQDETTQDLTVGGSDVEGQDISGFSSSGPVWGTNAIKPDVLAPGNRIQAPSISGGYLDFSGTSSSAPHVSGAAAVLLNAARAKGWDVNPGTLKAAIMAGARTIEKLDLYNQGAGYVNVTQSFLLLNETQKIGSHPILGLTLPELYPIEAFRNVLQGTTRNDHLSFVSSEFYNLSVSVEGNVSSFISFPNLVEGSKLTEFYSHDIVVTVDVPNNATIGKYTGNIVFKCNDTIITSTPVEIGVDEPNLRLLLHTGYKPSQMYQYNVLGEMRDTYSFLAQNKILVNEITHQITEEELSNYDILWVAACNKSKEVWSFNSKTEDLYAESEDIEVAESEIEAMKEFIDNGNHILMSPFSIPTDLEPMINDWGIYSSDHHVSVSESIPAIMTKYLPIGKEADYYTPAGTYLEVDSNAISLAYHNRKENIVMAAHDEPGKGRVVVTSGSRFASILGITNEIIVPYDYQGKIFNDILLMEIIDWLTSETSFYGTYSVSENTVSANLYAENNSVQVNNAILSGYYQNLRSNDIIWVNDSIPTSGVNGWYNFSFNVGEGSFDLKFYSNLIDDSYFGFHVTNDETSPTISVSGIENNTHLGTSTYIYFWLEDGESGIDQQSTTMTLDGDVAGFNLKYNDTTDGYYIKKKLYPDDLGSGWHTIILTTKDYGGNSAEIIFKFSVGELETTTDSTSPKSSNFISITYLILFLPVFYGLMRKRRK